MKKVRKTSVIMNGPILCYSGEWTRLAAMNVLCQEAHPESEVVCFSDIGRLLCHSAQMRPQLLVLAITARTSVSFLYRVRRQNPNVAVIILQDEIRIIDEAVSDYIGRAMLLNISGMHPDDLRERLESAKGQVIALPSPGRRFFYYCGEDSPFRVTIMMEIESCLYKRLSAKTRSARLREEAMRWFSQAVTVPQLAGMYGIAARIIYQRRSTLCQILKTRPSELPFSLRAEWGE